MSKQETVSQYARARPNTGSYHATAYYYFRPDSQANSGHNSHVYQPTLT